MKMYLFKWQAIYLNSLTQEVKKSSVTDSTLVFAIDKQTASNLFATVHLALQTVTKSSSEWEIKAFNVDGFKDFGNKSTVDFEAKKKTLARKGKDFFWINGLIGACGCGLHTISSWSAESAKSLSENGLSSTLDRITVSAEVAMCMDSP